jgi:hypothetical protein
MKKNRVSKIIREEIARVLRETNEASKGPNDPTDDAEFDAASDAAQTAHDLGLVHTTYGRYEDPKHPEKGTVAKSIKGQLVKVTGGEAPQGEEPAADEPEQPTAGGTPPEQPPTAPPAPPAPEEPEGDPSMHPEAASTLNQYISSAGGNENAAKVKIEKVLHSLDNQMKIIKMRGKHAMKTTAFKKNQDQIKKHRDALALLAKSQPAQSTDDIPAPPAPNTPVTNAPEVPGVGGEPEASGGYIDKASTTPPQAPGSIQPPTKPNGDPWRVQNKHNGKPGYIDIIDNDKDEAHVSYDDGSFEWVRTNDISPVEETPAQKSPLTSKDAGSVKDMMSLSPNQANKLKSAGKTLTKFDASAIGPKHDAAANTLYKKFNGDADGVLNWLRKKYMATKDEAQKGNLHAIARAVKELHKKHKTDLGKPDEPQA